MAAKTSEASARILLLAGDQMGANCMMGGKKLSILDKFKRYGWEVTLAGVTKTIAPCPYAAKIGAKPMTVDCTIDEIADITKYDVLSVLPGPSFQGLIASEHTLTLIRTAFDAGLVVSGWCRGVRVLAEAGVLRGKQVVGHEDDRTAIEAAGGTFVGRDHPPVIDGNLVTGARSYYYRAKNADAIKKAVMARRA